MSYEPIARSADPLDPSVDFPSTIDDHVLWLKQAGLEPAVAWADDDLAVIAAAKNKVALGRFD